MQLLQAFFLIIFLVFISRYWKTEDTKLLVLAWFCLCMAVV